MLDNFGKYGFVESTQNGSLDPASMTSRSSCIYLTIKRRLPLFSYKKLVILTWPWEVVGLVASSLTKLLSSLLLLLQSSSKTSSWFSLLLLVLLLVAAEAVKRKVTSSCYHDNIDMMTSWKLRSGKFPSSLSLCGDHNIERPAAGHQWQTQWGRKQ